MSENNHIETLIIRYLEQNISEEDIRELDRWLGESADNKTYFFQLKGIYDRICRSRHFNEEELEESWKHMLDKLESKPSTIPLGNDKKKNIFISSLKYVAIIVVAILMGWGIGEITGTQTHDSENNSLAWNEIEVQKGGKPSTILLSDGSKVSLNTATTFRYPTNFSEIEREVFLDGEAYFEIKEDALKPFIVKLKDQHITVLGTTFNIEAYTDENYSIITLLSGSISLETFNEKQESVSNQLMKPNQRAYFDRQSGIVSLESVDASLSNVWMNGEYKFRDEPLYLILKRLENYYGITIYLESESLRNIKYTGTFNVHQSIQEVLKIINYEKQFTFSELNKENEIYIRMSNFNEKI
ncbi:MAG: DUF4974 domain-containing protein [Tannerella sp.]|jgi:ferric-dicitrate binding protein FerR (iron transport regulator)|nr:DUF4974 domain-containing protein [Tannerella sp.]